MLKFVIDKIQLRNVRHYGDQITEMDFPVDNVTVFTGPVGAGKSTILKSVSMALYGDDGGVKGEKLSIDDMVNERVGKNLEIHLYIRSIDTLDNDREDKYEIHLYHKHSKMSNKLVFMKNGVDISANGKMDTYRLIEQTFIPKEVYHNIYYFTQQAKNFFTALPNSEQKAIFDSILDLSEYDMYYQNCRNEISKYEKTIDELEIKLKLIQDSIRSKNELIAKEEDNIKKAIEDNEEQIKNIKILIEEYKNKLKKEQDDNILELSISEIEENINKLQTETKLKLSEICHNISLIETEINKANDDAKNKFEIEKSKVKDELQPIIDDIKSKISKCENEKTAAVGKRTIETSESYSAFERKVSQIKDKYKTELQNIEREIDSKKNIIITEKSKVNEYLTNLKNKALQEKSDIESKIHELDIELREYSSAQLKILEEETKCRDIILKNRLVLQSETPHCDKCGQALINTDHLIKENEELEKTADNCKKSAKEYKVKEDAIQENIKELKDKIVIITNDFKTESNKYISEFKKIEETLQTEIHDLEFSRDNINSKMKIELDSERQKQNSDNSLINSKYDALIKTLDGNKQDLESKIEYETTKSKQKLVEISTDIKTKLANKIDELEAKFIDLKTQHTDIEKKCNIKVSELQLKKSDALNRQNIIDSYEKKISDSETQLKFLQNFKASDATLMELKNSKENDVKALSAVNEEYEENKRVLEILQFWKTAFSDSGIKSMLIDVAIPHMNQCVREELERVCPGTFTVSFDTLSETKSGNIRDKFSINIIHNLKCATGHKKLSGGEKRIIDFCCMSALRSLAEKLYNKMFSHIFYDEVMDSLDSETRELFCRSMKYQSNDHRNITLVTHALTEDVDPDRVFPF